MNSATLNVRQTRTVQPRRRHLHYIIPGGALRFDGKKWLPARAGDWLLLRAAVAAAFRTGFGDALAAAAPELHAQIGDAVWRTGWWVHFAHAGSGQNVVRYLARYVGQTAISDERIMHADDQTVRFCYTDSQTRERKDCTLTAEEFMRRYLQHVLPRGLHRVRYPPEADKSWLDASGGRGPAEEGRDAALGRHRRTG